MLRELRENIALDNTLLNQTVQRFMTDPIIESLSERIDISPDSFIWELVIDGQKYILYAEDYVMDIKYIEEEILETTGAKKGEFLKVLTQKDFEELSPVQSASVYVKVDNFEESIQPYAADSGYDLVFLYKVTNI